MAFTKHVCTMLAAIAFLPAAASAAAPKKVEIKGRHDPSEVVIKGVRDPSAWFRVESEHLVVYSDQDPEQVGELVDNLERLDYLLRLYMKDFLTEPTPSRKFTLYFQGQVRWPAEIGAHSSHAIGLLASCESATQGFTFDLGRMWKLDNASLLRAENDYTLMWKLMMYSDSFLYRHTRIRKPHWFVVGFVMFFGGVRFTDNQMAIGRDAGQFYDLLQSIDNGDHAKSMDFEDVLRSGTTVKPVSAQTAEYAWEFQGRSFNLVHYMLSSEENRRKMAEYLERVNSGGDPAKTFYDLYGMAGNDIDAAMWRYRRKDMKILKIDNPDLPKARIEFTRLSRVEGDFVLDNAMLKSCPTPADGKKILERLKTTAAKVSAVDFAQVTLARAQIDWGNPRDAIPWLTAARQRDPDNPELHYLLGLAHLRLAEGADGQDARHDLLAAARASLTEAATMAPEDPAASYALFRAELMAEDTPSERGVARAIDAWRHGQDIPAFTRAAALAYAWLGDAAGAYQAFHTLAMNERAPADAKWAATWLANLEKGVPKEALLAAMRSERPAISGPRLFQESYR